MTAWSTPLWEVFVRSRRGPAHVHVGSVHAADAELALRHARDVFTRRQEGVSLWVVPSTAVTASTPEDQPAFFEPPGVRRKKRGRKRSVETHSQGRYRARVDHVRHGSLRP